MNRLSNILLIIILCVTFFSCTNMNINPLIDKTTKTHFNAPPFDKIKIEDYIPAINNAVEESMMTVDAIINNGEEPTFNNTIAELEYSGVEVSRISSIFFNLNSACTNAEMQNIAMEISNILTDYSNNISLNEKLFERVKAVYDKRDMLLLNSTQKRLLKLTYKGFERSGAALSNKDKDVYREIDKELSNLSIRFEQNLLSATNKYYLHITDSSKLVGLPEYVIDMGAEDAKGKNLTGWIYTLNTPSYVAFMKFSQDRTLREELWREYNRRCLGGEYDNTAVLMRMVELRIKKAKLLGYKCYSDYALENRMAESTDNVNDFLDTLLSKSMPFAKKEFAMVQEYAKSKGVDFNLMPWDFSYYSEKLKDDQYAINDAMLKPYFELSNVVEGVFSLADKLYGLKFKENKEIPVYHPDVSVFEVYDSENRFMSLLYLDFFPRESKNSGAWMTSYREQYVYNGKEYRPFISVVCNFTKPTTGNPSLLTFDEVTTFLHEFGHALHGIFSDGVYPSLTGTNVTRDFVELPSQIMENWALEKEFLNTFAKHYKTGETIPDSLINKIIKAKNFLSGYHSVRQISFGINDMAWHSLTEMPAQDVLSFEKETLKRTNLMPIVDSTNFSVAFSHIFSGGYTAGYYSYKWAEVLEADAFSKFEEKGIFDKETANSFRKEILSKGDSRPAMELYKNFMGREPKVDALLKKLGLL